MSGYVKNLPWSLGPYDWFPAAAPDRIAASAADAAIRPIGVTVFLEDPRARTAYVHVQLPARSEYHVTTADGTVVDIWLHATPDGQFLSSVVLGTRAAAPIQAFGRCYAYLLSLLSSWSFQAQRPMGVREILVEDKAHGAEWGVRPQAQAPLRLNDLKASFSEANPLGSLMALFREGMASTQPSHRFLCYYKILDAWRSGDGPFKWTNEQLKAKDATRPRFVIEEAMFAGKQERNKYEALLGKKFTWCIDQMNEPRKFLAHPFSEQGRFLSLDHPLTLAALSEVANVAERMVIEILVEEIKLLRSLTSATDAVIDGVIAGYIHESWGDEVLKAATG